MTSTPPHRRHFEDLPDFAAELERRGLLIRIAEPVSVVHEITEVHRRVLRQNGPALLFENPATGEGRPLEIPVLTNLFGTRERIELGLGLKPGNLGHLASALAKLRDPQPPRSFADALGYLPQLRAVLAYGTKQVGHAACQEVIWAGDDIDLGRLPVQWCWPDEPAPLITWPLVITRSPENADDINVGVYRVQVLGRDRAIVRWLPHRGGARHHRQWCKLNRNMPIAIVVGADPATILSAVMPLPEDMSELSFSGMLSGRKARIVEAISQPLSVPATSEIVIEGEVSATETAPEGPFGDHTGYYNAVENFPVMRVTAVTMRRRPIYLTTFTGRPPDEPSVLGEAMNELFIPLVRKQFPEVEDLWLPPEACSYRAIVVSIDKRYPGQARRVMMGLWSMLPQFSYTKLIIAVDPDINIRNWADVMWAVATRFDASRDCLMLSDTPIDYLDFASPKPGLGGKLGIDATCKIGPETEREWGTVLAMSAGILERVDQLWDKLGLGVRP